MVDRRCDERRVRLTVLRACAASVSASPAATAEIPFTPSGWRWSIECLSVPKGIRHEGGRVSHATAG